MSLEAILFFQLALSIFVCAVILGFPLSIFVCAVILACIPDAARARLHRWVWNAKAAALWVIGGVVSAGVLFVLFALLCSEINSLIKGSFRGWLR